MSDYIITTRGIRGGSFSSEPGPTRFIKVPERKNPDPSHQINRIVFIADVVGTPAAQKCEDIVVLVHGYNFTKSDLIQRHRKIRSGLAKAGYKGEVLSFDWPAKGKAANTLEDRSDARRVALQLVDDGITTFAALVKKGCTIHLHRRAHSTGGFIIRETSDAAADRDSIAKTNWSVSQIRFAATDISSMDMAETSSNSNSLNRQCVRLTSYHNPYDSALMLSNVKRVGVGPRVGRLDLPESAPAKPSASIAEPASSKPTPPPTPSSIPSPTVGISTISSPSKTLPSPSPATWIET